MNKPGNANLQHSSFGVEGVAGLNLVEAPPHVQQHMPEVVHVPPPLVRKSSPDVQLPRVRADQRVKHWGLKNNRLGKRGKNENLQLCHAKISDYGWKDSESILEHRMQEFLVF